WAEFIELFGQPIRIIKYDSYDTQTRAELRQALEESGSSLSLMLPRQADFEMVNGKEGNSDGSLHNNFLKMLNDEMSVIVLGNTETTSASSSSGYAQSRIHLQQQYEITRNDLAYVVAALNSPQFLSILSSYGYATAQGHWQFAREMDIEYLAQRITIDRQVAEMVAIPASYWYNTYGIAVTD
ncbi:MAG: DUF935 family protein, partial [Chitinophagia bacterium]|nr:DUF935 family protein [Chitinophagia bacterium]